MLKLRNYQIDIVSKLRAAYKQGFKAPLLVAPTGSGKTVCFADITDNAIKKGNSVLILVHRQELLNQTTNHLSYIGLPHTCISPNRPFVPGSKVQVASVQTLVRRLERTRAPDIIIIDEAHHAAAGSWRKVIKQFNKAMLLGVTATPERLDGKGLGVSCGGCFDTMVEAISVEELINLGFLSRPIYYAPSQLDLSKVHTRAGDYAKEEVNSLITKSAIVGDAVKTYARICPFMPAVAFCASVEAAESTAAQFSAAGFPALSLDGKLTSAERARRINALTRGDIYVLTSCDIISEGFDLPRITTAILLRPTQSLSLHLQQIGRALRPAPGKTNAFILDHTGNLFRHGLAEEYREWSLDGKRVREREKRPIENRRCPKCFAVHAPAPKCPQCGYVYLKRESEDPEHIAGELAQISAAEIQMARERALARREIGMASSFEALRLIENRRGYKNGWAKHVWAAKNRKNTPDLFIPEV